MCSAVASWIPFDGVQNCSGFPGSTYIRQYSHMAVEVDVERAHPLYSITGPKLFYFPLQIIRCVCNRRRAPTYTAPSFLEVFGGTTAHFPRVYFDVKVGVGVNVLDLVDPWFQFPVFEDRSGVTGRIQGHGWQGECDGVESKSQPRRHYCALSAARARHTFAS